MPNFGDTRVFFATFILVIGARSARAQWELESSHTNVDLRGIYSVGGGVAWASGTNGTVLRTQNDGKTWEGCATPPGTEHLDFRGVQASDEHTALVMSSGKGDLSRLYKTTDGCRTWKLLFTNPDEDGFWDAILHDATLDETFVLGDPVQGSFMVYWSRGDDDQHWSKWWNGDLKAFPGQAAFAASNSLLISAAGGRQFSFVTGGSRSELISASERSRSSLPFAAGESSGAFSVARGDHEHVVVVGGDYKRPDQREGTTAFSTDGARHFSSSHTLPGGYRSAVAYDRPHKTFIAVGPNGTDVSRDGGLNWRALRSTPEEAAGSDREWNALSLPFVVGPHGRIGRLRPASYK